MLAALTVAIMYGDTDSLARCACHAAQARGAVTSPAPSPAAGEPLTYSLAEAAQRIGGISERGLAMKLRAGEVSGYKIGRQWRMGEGDIQEFIARSRVTRRSDPARQEAPRGGHPPGDATQQDYPVIGDQYSLLS